MPDVDKLLTLTEVSQQIGISVRSISRWIQQGKIDAVPMGNAYRITYKTLQMLKTEGRRWKKRGPKAKSASKVEKG